MFIMPNEAWSAILGAVVGSFITYRFGITLADRQFQHLKAVSKLDAWHAAAQNFVAVFSEELATVEGEEELTIPLDDYLRGAYRAKHKAAISTFRHFLEPALSARFDAACYQYHSGRTTEEMIETGIPKRDAMFMEYMGHPFPGDPYQKARNRIQAILQFAKHEQHLPT